MNLVGKIFVVLIMVMSVFFAALATMVYSTHQNWRDMVIRKADDVKGNQQLGLIYQLENEKERYAELDEEKKQLEQQLAALQAAKVQQLAKLEAERLRLAQERDEIASNYKTLIDTREAAIEDVRLAQVNLTRMGEQIDTLRTTIRDARALIDDKFKEVELKTERYNIAQGQLALLERRSEELSKNFAEAKELLEAGGGGESTDAGAPASVEGFVTAVNNQKKLAEVSIGSDDGVKEGHDLEVFRDGVYIGQLTIVRTTTDRAVGKIGRLVRPMNRGDKVSTRDNLNLAATR